MVDFVLVLLLLVPLLGGVLQVALTLHVRNTLASAAAEGARHAALQGSSPEQGEAKILAQVATALPGGITPEVDVHPAVVAGSYGYEAVVEASVPVLGLGGPALKVRVSGHAVAEIQPDQS